MRKKGFKKDKKTNLIDLESKNRRSCSLKRVLSLTLNMIDKLVVLYRPILFENLYTNLNIEVVRAHNTFNRTCKQGTVQKDRPKKRREDNIREFTGFKLG